MTRTYTTKTGKTITLVDPSPELIWDVFVKLKKALSISTIVDEASHIVTDLDGSHLDTEATKELVRAMAEDGRLFTWEEMIGPFRKKTRRYCPGVSGLG